MNVLRTALMTDDATASAFKRCCNKERLTLAAHFQTAGELMSKLPTVADAVFVIDTTIIDKDSVDKIIDALAEGKYKFVCICHNATEGFSYMSRGALDMLIKHDNLTSDEMVKHLCVRINTAEEKHKNEAVRTPKFKGAARSDKVVLIGSSTGGAETVTHIMKQFPQDMPPVVVVQHMPPVFTNLYAERLNEICRISIWEARDKDELLPGTALIAPGDHQVRLAKNGGKLVLEVYQGEKVNGHAPSADVLFYSAAALVGHKAVGIILTGMGKDGAAGLLALRNSGAYTIGQDKDSSVVYGMPKAAYDIGAVVQQAHYEDIARIILENL